MLLFSKIPLLFSKNGCSNFSCFCYNFFYLHKKGLLKFMKHRKLPSLSYKLYSIFIISFLIPMTLICIFLSYLFSSYQTREIQEQAANKY